MATYRIEWTREVYYEAEVEAESFADATRKFWAGEVEGWTTGNEIQDSVEVTEV